MAIIMDGNGRWAEKRGLSRNHGHEAGVESIRVITTECARIKGMEQLTLYALSAENFLKRPPTEIKYLLGMLSRYLRREYRTIMDNNVRLLTIGNIDVFPIAVRRRLDRVMEGSSKNPGLKLCLALNYGGREDITRAAKNLARAALEGRISPEEIDEKAVAAHLYTKDMPDPDLLIRTAGEVRVSNFLLWQISYAELWVTEVYWPDFRQQHLYQALRDYARRERKFGGLGLPQAQKG